MRRTNVTALMAALVLIVGVAAWAAAGTKPLDGRTYEVKLTNADTKETVDDFLIFGDGSFLSTACRSYGFGKVAYDAGTTAKGGVTFEAKQTNPANHSTQEWNGMVNAGRIEGTVLYIGKDGQKGNYSFSGQMLP